MSASRPGPGAPATPPASAQVLLPEAPPYWLRYSGRLVRFGSLDRATRRLAVTGSVAAILGLLILTLPLGRMAAVPMPPVPDALRVPWLVLGTATLLEAAGWWYLVSGALLGGARVRLPVALALLVFAATALPDDRLLTFATLALGAFVVLTAWRATSLWVARTAAAVGVVLIFGLMLRDGPALYALTLVSQTAVSYLLLVPVIFYSGYDLGQTALHGVRLGLLRLHGRVGVPLLAVAVILVVALKFWLLIAVEHGLSPSVLPALAVLAAAFALSRWLSPARERPPELWPALAAFLVLGAIFGSGSLARVWGAAAALALVLGVGLVLRAWRGRARDAHAAVYLVVFGLWNLLNVITIRSGSPFGLLAHWPWPIDARALDEAVIVAALAYGGWLAARRALTGPRLLLLLFWLVGLSLVLGLWRVLGGLEHLSHGALPAEALLLAIGIGHEVAASGGLLNRGSAAVPRASRVLLYLGYLLVVAGSTVIADGSAGPTAGAIQSDALQQGGLILIGIPLYLQMFAHALAVGRAPEPEDEGGDVLPGAPVPAPLAVGVAVAPSAALPP